MSLHTARCVAVYLQELVAFMGEWLLGLHRRAFFLLHNFAFIPDKK
jgi:hypothetical protein